MVSLRWIGLGIIFLLVFSGMAWAQPINPSGATAISTTTPFNPLRDLINELSDKIDVLAQRFNQLQSDFTDHVVEFSLFKDDTDTQLSQIDSNITGVQEQIDNLAFEIDKTKVYEVIQIYPPSNTAFCNDPEDILLHAYCDGGQISTVAYEGSPPLMKPLLFDNFDGGIWHVNWQIDDGSVWPADNNYLSTSGALANVAIHINVFDPDLPGNTDWFDESTISFKSRVIGFEGDTAYYEFGVNAPSVNAYKSGRLYALVAKFGENWKFDLSDNPIGGSGPYQITLIDSGVPIVSGQWYDMEIYRDDIGVFTWKIDGQVVGSVQDNTITKYYGFALETGDSPIEMHLDDVNIFIVDNDRTYSGFLNLNDPAASSGVQCTCNDCARLVCLEQS